MKLFIFAAYFVSSIAMANDPVPARIPSPSEELLPPVEKPARCLKENKSPCAVWVLSKSKHVRDGVEVRASRNSLYEWRDGNIYLVQGTLWVKSPKAVKVSGRFGTVTVPVSGTGAAKNEVLVQASDEAFIARAGGDALTVLPLGSTDSLVLHKGFEIRFSYVDREFGTADFTWPTVLDLASYLKALQKTTDEEAVRAKAQSLAGVVKEAAVLAAREHALAVGRMVASTSRTSGPKESDEEDASRDLRLRRLFRIKSDFAE